MCQHATAAWVDATGTGDREPLESLLPEALARRSVVLRGAHTRAGGWAEIPCRVGACPGHPPSAEVAGGQHSGSASPPLARSWTTSAWALSAQQVRQCPLCVPSPLALTGRSDQRSLLAALEPWGGGASTGLVWQCAAHPALLRESAECTVRMGETVAAGTGKAAKKQCRRWGVKTGREAVARAQEVLARCASTWAVRPSPPRPSLPPLLFCATDTCARLVGWRPAAQVQASPLLRRALGEAAAHVGAPGVALVVARTSELLDAAVRALRQLEAEGRDSGEGAEAGPQAAAVGVESGHLCGSSLAALGGAEAPRVRWAVVRRHRQASVRWRRAAALLAAPLEGGARSPLLLLLHEGVLEDGARLGCIPSCVVLAEPAWAPGSRRARRDEDVVRSAVSRSALGEAQLPRVVSLEVPPRITALCTDR